MVCALILAATLSPWLWRSYRLTGVPALSTVVGRQLWVGNNALLLCDYPAESIDVCNAEAFDALSTEDRRALQQTRDNEVLQDRWFLQKGWAYIQADPWLTFENGLRKIGAGFGLLPSPRRGFVPNLVHALSFGPVMLLGLWGMWRHREHWRKDSLIYALFGVFALESAVFFAHTSHRSFLDVYWIVFAAGAMAGRLAPTCRQRIPSMPAPFLGGGAAGDPKVSSS
jgi:hypothetical protein